MLFSKQNRSLFPEYFDPPSTVSIALFTSFVRLEPCCKQPRDVVNVQFRFES